MPFFRSQTPHFRGRKRSADLNHIGYNEKSDSTAHAETLYETSDEPRDAPRDVAEHRDPETPPMPINSEPSPRPEPRQDPVGAVLNAPSTEAEPSKGFDDEAVDDQSTNSQNGTAQSLSEMPSEQEINDPRHRSRGDLDQPDTNLTKSASIDQGRAAGNELRIALPEEAEDDTTEQPQTPPYRGFDPLSIATSPGSYHISSEGSNAQGYFGSAPAGRKESTGQPVSVNLNHCRAGKPNKRGKPTVGKPKRQIRDHVILPDTKAYTEIGGFLVGRVEVRYGIKLPVENIKAIALTKGKPGEGVEIVDDETWKAARKMLERGERGGGEERTKDANGREADLELWFVTGREDGESKKCVVM